MSTIENGRDVAREMWEKVERVFPVVGQEVQSSSLELAAMLGTSIHRTRTSLQLFRKLGLVGMRAEYELRKQNVFYARLADRDTAIKAIDAHFDLGRGFNYYKDVAPDTRRPLTKEPKVEDETVAIVGPDPEPTVRAAMADVEPAKVREVTEPEALLEAARQYANRAAAVVEHIGALEAMGITINRDQLAKAIKVENDPVLDAVSRLLPVFDRGQRTVERLTAENESLRAEVKERRRETSALANELHAMKEANKRLSERNTNLAGQLAEASSAYARA